MGDGAESLEFEVIMKMDGVRLGALDKTLDLFLLYRGSNHERET